MNRRLQLTKYTNSLPKEWVPEYFENRNWTSFFPARLGTKFNHVNKIQLCLQSNLDSWTVVTYWFALNPEKSRFKEQHMMSILRPVIRRNKHSCLYVKSLTICSSCASFYGIKKTMCCLFKGVIRTSSFFCSFYFQSQ